MDAQQTTVTFIGAPVPLNQLVDAYNRIEHQRAVARAKYQRNHEHRKAYSREYMREYQRRRRAAAKAAADPAPPA